jgi:hypothetical protein
MKPVQLRKGTKLLALSGSIAEMLDNRVFKTRVEKVSPCFILSKTGTDEEMIELVFFRHLRTQKDINQYYKDEIINVSK